MAQMPQPRNQNRITTSVNLDAGQYDALRAATRGRLTQDVLSRLVKTFLSLPRDAREILLADVSPSNRARVLRALLRAAK